MGLTRLLRSFLHQVAVVYTCTFRGGKPWPLGQPRRVLEVCFPVNPDCSKELPPAFRSRLQRWSGGAFYQGPCNQVSDDPNKFVEVVQQLAKDGFENQECIHRPEGTIITCNRVKMACLAGGKYRPGKSVGHGVAGFAGRESTSIKCGCLWSVGLIVIHHAINQEVVRYVYCMI